MTDLLTTDPHLGVDIDDASAFIDNRIDAASTERQLEVLLSFVTSLRAEIDAIDEDGEEHFVRFDALKRLARMICY